MDIAGNFKNRVNQVRFNLPVISFMEENVHFLYTPALDLTGYGNTEEEALRSFEETIGQFLEYGINKKTLEKELKKLGWIFTKKKISKAPSLVDMITHNKYLAEIFEEKQYKKFDRTFDIPALA